MAELKSRSPLRPAGWGRLLRARSGSDLATALVAVGALVSFVALFGFGAQSGLPSGQAAALAVGVVLALAGLSMRALGEKRERWRAVIGGVGFLLAVGAVVATRLAIGKILFLQAPQAPLLALGLLMMLWATERR